ncbi:MAG: radical SAM protein [Alphaproteobacteria bacterium]
MSNTDSAYPKLIEIETISSCNAACVMCAHATTTRPKTVMDADLYAKIIDEIASFENMPFVSLHGIGEPLLDKRLEDRIRYARSRGIPSVSVLTNGSLLTPERGRSLADAGMSYLGVSLDTMRPDLFERTRVNLRFETVVNNIKAFFEMRRKHAPALGIGLSYVRPEHADDNDEKFFFECWEEYLERLDSISITSRHNFAGKAEASFVSTNNKCNKIFDTMNIRADGTVPLCCVDSENAYILGNVCNNSIIDIFNSKVIKKVRSIHSEGRRGNMILCGGCTVPEAMSAWRVVVSPIAAGESAFKQEDYATALSMWQRPALRGNSEAQYGMGILFEHGLSVAKDYTIAADWYRRAAESGHIEAQFNLGSMLEEGQGVGRDYVESAKWYLLAASQGNAAAQCNLAGLYERGQGVSRDMEQALLWITRAISGLSMGEERNAASAVQDRLAKSMSPERVATLMSQARS